MEFSFEGRVVLTLNHEEGANHSTHVSTDFNLDVIGGLDRTKYLDEEDLPNKEGSKVLTNVLVQGLIGNIHMAHENGYRDSAEHLRWIISELESGFVALTTIEKSYFKE